LRKRLIHFLAECKGETMSTKLKNGLIKALTYTLSLTGSVIIIVFQYISEKNPMPSWAKVTVPCLLGLLIFFLVYYKSIKEKINRKLIAIETAKEMGKAGQTNTVVANILEVMGIVIPVALIAAIFVIGGKYLTQTGIVLFEMLGMFTITIIGNIVCDSNKKEELRKKEQEQAEALANSIAKQIDSLPKKYE